MEEALTLMEQTQTGEMVAQVEELEGQILREELEEQQLQVKEIMVEIPTLVEEEQVEVEQGQQDQQEHRRQSEAGDGQRLYVAATSCKVATSAATSAAAMLPTTAHQAGATGRRR